MSFADHFNGVMVVVEELARAGAEVRVWTDAAFRDRIEAAGGQFADLFALGSLDSVDDKSMPRSARCVTFAAERGEVVTAEAAAFRPDLIIHDSFALIGRVVADELDLPRVVVTAGHAVDAAAFRTALLDDPRVAIDPRCWAAVHHLRDKYGIVDASPFSYVADPSPVLNICKEPAEWVSDSERAFLGPIAFFGALPRDAMQRGMAAFSSGGPRIYAAFGTVIWRYWTEIALGALESLAGAVAAIPGASLAIGLGGARIPQAARAALAGQGVVVHDFADQWMALRNADVFVTHHGLGSTHEAVACAVPMLSVPFFWDQPNLARRAQELGVALPLIDGDMRQSRLERGAIAEGLAGIAVGREAMLERLIVARRWEARTIAARPEIVAQILALARAAK